MAMAPQIKQVPRINVTGPRIDSVPVVRQVPPPVLLPRPVTTQIRQPVLDVPTVDVPTYDPPVIDMPLIPGFGSPQNSQPVNQGEEIKPAVPKGTEIQVLGTPIPVPTSREVALAGTTAAASVAAALVGKSLVEYLIKVFKPVIKQGVLKLKEKLGKRLSDEEVQLYFALEQKSLVKRLKKEQKKSIAEQRQRRHQRRQQRKDYQGGT